MIYHFVISGRLPGLNQLIASQGRPWWMGAKAKDDAMTAVKWQLRIQAVPQFKVPVKIKFIWVEPNAKRDRDNVSSGGSKIILDAMKQMEVIKDDSRRWVVDIENDTKRIDKANPRIEVWIEEVL